MKNLEGGTQKDETVKKSDGSATGSITSTFDDVKANCKARKRKERQESGSSLCQDRKVIRSNSEERACGGGARPSEKTSAMRRVFSSGDFPRSTSGERAASTHSQERIHEYEDLENERRRSHERFARPLAMRARKKRLKVRHVAKLKIKTTDNLQEKETAKKHTFSKERHRQQYCSGGGQTEHDEKVVVVEKRRSPSPEETAAAALDFATLYETAECGEPLLSCRPSEGLDEDTETMPGPAIASNRLHSSPRNSIIATHRIYLDRDVPHATPPFDKEPQNPVVERTQKLSKQINGIKKKIKEYEAFFEAQNGFKPSQADKLKDRTMKQWYSDLNKLKKEQKQLSEVSSSCILMEFNSKLTTTLTKTTADLKQTVKEIEQKLCHKREAANRCYALENMSPEQLVEEKVAIQKALLYLESVHGRPSERDDRNVVRPFYDRYRSLKRMIAKIATTSGATGNELATIHEDETMHFVTPTSSFNDTESEVTDPPKKAHNTDSDLDDTSFSENLNSMSKPELDQQLKRLSEEKKELRRSIKQFESEMQSKSGRMLQKEDRMPMESVYTAYKKTKAKMRLLEALLGKEMHAKS